MSDGHHELIIIKRHDEEEHEHHSSAWKVAHADFMTAMMAFFLIMWLINVTDQDVRKAIAQYFNPVNLAENLSPRIGLEDPDKIKDQGTSDNGEAYSSLKNTMGPKNGPGNDLQQGARERQLFQDPYATLATLADEAQPDNKPSSADVPVGEVGLTGTGSGEAQRDPFDPAYWQVASGAKRAAEGAAPRPNSINSPSARKPDAAAAPSEGPTGGGRSETQAGAKKAGVGEAPGAGPAPAAASAAAGAPPAPMSSAAAGSASSASPVPAQMAGGASAAPMAPTTPAAPEPFAPPPAGGAAGATPEQQARSIQSQVNAAVAANMGSQNAPHVEVRATAEGLVINLTDDTNFSMFSVGSAVPDGRLVRVMERIGQILAARPGEIVVRGYTDGRPYRSPGYDNWRLSSDRAHISYFMLMRGGIDERRFAKIEGFADRSLKNTADANAPENRRIEILLKEPQK